VVHNIRDPQEAEGAACHPLKEVVGEAEAVMEGKVLEEVAVAEVEDVHQFKTVRNSCCVLNCMGTLDAVLDIM